MTFSVQDEAERHLAIIDDFCDDGMGLSVERCFAPGTGVEIVLEEEEQETYFIGEVKWCEPDIWLEGTFHLGVATRIKLVT